VATAWIRTTFGQTGVLVLAAAVGATDIDPSVINIAQGGVMDLSITMLSAAILIAASSNNVAKAIYAIAFGGKSSRRPALVLCFGLIGIRCCGCLHPAAGTTLNIQSTRSLDSVHPAKTGKIQAAGEQY
jgi:uncharacterized membrane protein (DUF4010 family)